MADNASRPGRTATIDLLPDFAFGAAQARVRLRPGTFEAVDPAGPAALPPAPRPPLNRRRRRVRRATAALVGSGAIHLLLLAALLFLRPAGLRSAPPEPPSVEMVFGHNGSAGLQGTSVPQDQQGAEAPPAAAAPPEALPPVEQPAPPTPAPAPAPKPAPPPVPAPTPTLPPPPPPAPEQRQTAERPRPRSRPTRQARRSSHSSNPFSNLTDLSLAPADVPETPNFTRRGRGGSGSAVNLSLGPVVRGGRLSMPFSMQGGHGMTSDYQELLDDWVNRHKYYPQSAADRGHDGQVAIHVTWDRNGRVLSVQLISGSGDTDLDDAWLGLFRGARLPPPPPDVPGDPIQYDMIMNYELLH